MRIDICRIGRSDASQISPLITGQIACLSRAARQVDELARIFAGADASVLDKAMDAIALLPPVADCSASSVVASGQLEPTDIGQRGPVSSLRGSLAEARTLYAVGQYEKARAIAADAVRDASSIGFAAVEAEAGYELGVALSGLDRDAEARETMEKVVWAAEAVGHGRLVVAATKRMISLSGPDAAGVRDGQRWARYARAALARLGGGTPAEKADIEDRLGALYAAGGQPNDAVKQHRKALELAVGATDALRGGIQMNLGSALERLNQYEEAAKLLAGAVDLLTRDLGPAHPRVATAKSSLGRVYEALGEYERALATTLDVLEMRRNILGPRHPLMATTYTDLGNVYFALGQLAKAVEGYRSAIDVLETVETDPIKLAAAYGNLAGVLAASHDYAAAMEATNTSLHQLTTIYREEQHPYIGYVLANRGELWARAKNHRAAADDYTRARDIFVARFGPDHPMVGRVLAGLGDAQLELGQRRAARESLERALEVLLESPSADDREPRAVAEFAMARLLGRGSARAMELARSAAQGFEEQAGRPQVVVDRRDAVKNWLRSRSTR
jgi:tetratricopeptide (TPR) repeat protein